MRGYPLNAITTSTLESTKGLAAALATKGPTAGLQYLNSRVAHRFTAIYELESTTLRCLFLYDKQREFTTELLAVVPLDDSYCQFVLRDGFFQTDNTANDRRLDGNSHQGVVMSYHGVPVVDHAGKLFGTLCHFDMVQQALTDEEFAYLQAAARLFTPYICDTIPRAL